MLTNFVTRELDTVNFKTIYALLCTRVELRRIFFLTHFNKQHVFGLLNNIVNIKKKKLYHWKKT